MTFHEQARRLWIAATGEEPPGRSPPDVRAVHAAAHQRLARFIAENPGMLSERGHRLVSRAAFAAFIDARTIDRTYSIEEVLVNSGFRSCVLRESCTCRALSAGEG